ncbi:MAG: MarR family winged helix-turn-helix transcriptional regulator [Candidatus Acidiferrales bacterium]
MAGQAQLGGKQGRRPFAAPEIEAYVNVLRTADALAAAAELLLKPAGLTGAQYNVLRILRGAGGEGLACREIGERMIARDPDITRLLDRLETRKLITRARDRRDRRVIAVRITQAALRILKGLDGAVLQLHRRQLRHMGTRKLAALNRLLQEARGSAQG